MNKQFIITNFAAFALMLFLSTGCRQEDGKQDAVQSYQVIKVSSSPVEISESYSPPYADGRMWTSCRKYPGALSGCAWKRVNG